MIVVLCKYASMTKLLSAYYRILLKFILINNNIMKFEFR